jgi:hypothetical protein
MTTKRILGCLRVPPVEYHCSKQYQYKPDVSGTGLDPFSLTCKKTDIVWC